MKPIKQNTGWQGMLARVTYRQWLLLAAAASCLLGLLVYMWLPDSEPRHIAVEQGPTVKVARAVQDIPERSEIKGGMVELVEVPAGLAPAGALLTAEEAIGKTAGMPIMAGDILTEKKILDYGMAGFVGAIPPDCRAVSVGVTDVTGVAGFARPGDHVDVMVISGKRNDNTVQGKLFLQDVLLLGINSIAVKSSGSGAEADASVGSPATATLALLPDQALKLATVSQEGKIYLSLRPYRPKDAVVLDTSYVTIADTTAAKPQAAAAPAPAAAPRYAAPAASAAAPAPQGGGNYGIQIFRGPGSKSEGK